MSRIVTLDPRTSRTGRSTAKFVSPRFLSLRQTRASQATQGPRSAIAASEQYRAQAEEYRFQAETFRDPKAQAQALHLAAIYDRKAVQAEEGGH